jgi:hypothetical protein
VTQKEEWMFKTANFDDTRLPHKEQIIGITDQDKAIAITKSYLKEKGTFNTSLGKKKLVISYHPEYNTFTAYNRLLNGKELEIDSVDVFGNSDQGKLERAYIYNSVLWAVWAHYYPETAVIQ